MAGFIAPGFDPNAAAEAERKRKEDEAARAAALRRQQEAADAEARRRQEALDRQAVGAGSPGQTRGGNQPPAGTAPPAGTRPPAGNIPNGLGERERLLYEERIRREAEARANQYKSEDEKRANRYKSDDEQRANQYKIDAERRQMEYIEALRKSFLGGEGGGALRAEGTIPGGGSPGGAPSVLAESSGAALPSDSALPGESNAASLSFARAKDKIGQSSRGAVDALRNLYAGSGNVGMIDRGYQNILGRGMDQLAGTATSQAAFEENRANTVADRDYARGGNIEDRNYAGELTRRGQNQNMFQSLLGLMRLY